MIHRIYSSLPSFKELRFSTGLNLILAQESPHATKLQTRNGAGKSSSLEIIHFLLGGRVTGESIFKNETLANYTFGMEFDLVQKKTIVERSGKLPTKLHILEADFDSWPISTAQRDFLGTRLITVDDWKDILGSQLFDLPIRAKEDKFSPSFRSIFSYFARRERDNGFSTPEKHSSIQPLWNQQVDISYLLGLDWTISQEWQKIRENEKALEIFRDAAKKGTFGKIIGTSAELRTMVIISEERARKGRDSLINFKVLPEYHELEQETVGLTIQLGEMADENILDQQLIEELERSFQVENPPDISELEKVYSEAGVTLPDAILRRFEEVRNFHTSVIQNRQLYLQSEIAAARNRIADHDSKMKNLENRLSEIMQILQSHGALDQFIKLQAEQSRRESDLQDLKQRFDAAEKIEGQKAELDIQRSQLQIRLRQDFKERASVLDEAILTFEELSNSLYEKAGSLNINPTSNGPDFQVKIQGDKSIGISKMQIFCFDIMLMQLCARRNIGPGFLIHDSHLFDGVDSRQIAKALTLGAKVASEYGFQYIVTMNDDVLPYQHFIDIDIEKFIVPVKITDETEAGGLFGFRF